MTSSGPPSPGTPPPPSWPEGPLPAPGPPTSTALQPPPPPGPPTWSPQETWPEPLPAAPRVRVEVGTLTMGAMASLGAAAVLGNIAMRAGVANAASVAAIGFSALVLKLVGAVETTRAKLMTAAALLIAAWLPIRASTWLVNLNAWTAATLLLAVALIGSGAHAPLSVRRAASLLRHVTNSALAGRLFADSLRPTSDRAWNVVAPILRGVVLAAVPVLILGALLAEADAVFATAVTPQWNVGSIFGHAALTAVVAVGVGGLVCITRTAHRYESAEDRRHVGAVESLVVLTLVAVLFGAFAITQLVSALGGAEHILNSQGLTRAEYAREGFFQLLAVAGLTLLLLTVLDAITRESRRELTSAARIAAAVVALLTVVIVAVSLVRLDLYTDAFGQTTLRWYCTSFAWMLGVLFILLAAKNLIPGERLWFGAATVAVVLGTLVTVNVMNPEARVAEHNLDRPVTELQLDANYLTGLSADAWPTLLAHRAHVVAALDLRGDGTNGAEAYFTHMCMRAAEQGGYGPLGFNTARALVDC